MNIKSQNNTYHDDHPRYILRLKYIYIYILYKYKHTHIYIYIYTVLGLSPVPVSRGTSKFSSGMSKSWWRQSLLRTTEHKYLYIYIYTHRIHVWYIHRYIWSIFMVNEGKYTTPMDPMGYGLSCVLENHLCASFDVAPWHQARLACFSVSNILLWTRIK